MTGSDGRSARPHAETDTAEEQASSRFHWPVLMRSRSTAAPVVLLALLYLLAWGPLLLSVKGVWWDDWTLVGGSPDGITAMFEQNGLPWVGVMHVFLVQFGPAVYHVVSMALFFLAGLALWGTLGTFPALAWPERFFVAALFLVLPFNAARNTMIVLPYTISLFLFYLAWYLLVRTERPKRLVLVLAAVAFLVSFTMNSLLVFYAVPIAHLWWRGHGVQGMSVLQFVKAWWPFLLLPFVFFGVKTIWFTPSGGYEGYNSFSRLGLAVASLLLILTAAPFLVLLSEHARLSLLARRVWLLAFGGLVLIALAVFPYVAVGHLPPYVEWLTRDEILMPLGAAVLLLAAVRLLDWRFGRRAAATFAIATVAVSIALSARIGLAYWVDWRKQQAIVALLANDDTVRTASLLVFEDETVGDNIFGSPYRFYAWNGLLTRAFDDSRRLGLNPSDLPAYLTGDYEPYYGPGKELDYGASMYVETGEAVVVMIKAGSGSGEYALSTTTIAASDLPSYAGVSG